jgi:hypothetical protein
MIIYKTKKKIALYDGEEATDLFALSNTGWMDCLWINDFNPHHWCMVTKNRLPPYPGYKEKGYKIIKMDDIQWYKNIGCLDNAIYSDKRLMKIIHDYFKYTDLQGDKNE